MYPNIDPTAPSVAVGTGAVSRPETDKVVETYKTPPNRETITQEEAGEAGTAAAIAKSPSLRSGRHATTTIRERDSVELGLQLTREERDVFVNALSGREDPAELTEREREVLQKTSERIEKILDDAQTFDVENRDRINKAVKEWYGRLSNNKDGVPEDLLSLIRKAARGRFYPLS